MNDKERKKFKETAMKDKKTEEPVDEKEMAQRRLRTVANIIARGAIKVYNKSESLRQRQKKFDIINDNKS